MKLFFALLLLFPKIVMCQLSCKKIEDKHKMEIDKNIFRLTVTLTTEPDLVIAANYEHEIKKTFTVVLKAGPAFSQEYLYTNAFNERQYRWMLKANASGELRYYYNLKRRIKLNKTVRNFSGCYLSIEPFVISKPLIIINKSGIDKTLGRSGAYINIGYQKQVTHTYFNAYFGTRFPGKIYSNSVDVFDILHGGITVGKVF